MKPKFTNSENLSILVLAIIGIQAIVSCSLLDLEVEDPDLSSSSIGGNSSSGGNVITIMYGDDFTDTRSGGGNKTYKTVVIGSQTWMAENLNYNAAGSKCYGEGGFLYNEKTKNYDIALSDEEIQVNCDKYGRLYDWVTVMGLDESCSKNKCAGQVQAKHQGICPSGWHVPSNPEWSILINFVDGTGGDEMRHSNAAVKILKATSGWYSNDNGTDEYGFAALPGGYGNNSSGIFYNVSKDGYWWSASEISTLIAYWRYMNWSNLVAGTNPNYDKTYLRSVRCVKD